MLRPTRIAIRVNQRSASLRKKNHPGVGAPSGHSVSGVTPKSPRARRHLVIAYISRAAVAHHESPEDGKRDETYNNDNGPGGHVSVSFRSVDGHGCG